MKKFFAIDLGATSGRTIVGTVGDDGIQQEEITRFKNPIITMTGHQYWDLYALYNEVVRGLQKVREMGITISSIGIDTWGCDVAIIGKDGSLLRNPLSYRDPHTVGVMEQYFDEQLPREKVYGITGIQFMNFNTLFQLYAMRKAGNSALADADKILFVPDALIYLLTGKAICEYTVCSTSEMLDPNKGDISEELLQSIGLKREQFGPMTQPGTIVGTLTPELQQLTGLGAVPVVAVAGHDTASAVAAVPAARPGFAYLSSGTWSLMGIESPHPIINDKSYDINFTNEGGIEGTTRFLKNICGMWLYEQCRREWAAEPGVSEEDLAHKKLQGDAMRVEGFRSLINPDDPCFANPKSMKAAIRDYCRQHGEPVPESRAEVCRCIFDSLALRYRQVYGWLQDFADYHIHQLHIIGGGSMNTYLNQFTANACGVMVVAGPQECTALGNIMLQAKAAGMVKDVWEMRSMIAKSVELRAFEPADTELWAKAYERYLEVTKEN